MANTKKATTATTSGFDFSKAEAAAENVYLKPGVYAMKISEVKLGTFPKGSPYLGLTFSTSDGLSFTEKMGFGSEKAKEVFMSRLQYLHEAWAGKKLDKVFKSIEEIEAYFAKTFASPKAPSKNVIIGGEVSGSNVYAALPYTNFIVPDDGNLELGEFEKDDANWKKYVKASARKSEASGKPGGILNEDDSEDLTTGGDDATDGDDDETPW